MNTHRRLPFRREEYERRYDQTLEYMQRAGVDVLLVRSPENITYLTGYETPGYYGYHCLVIARGEQPVLVGRRIELTNVPEFSWLTRSATVHHDDVPAEVTARTFEKQGVARRKIGAEKANWFFSVDEYESLERRLPRARLIDCSGVVENVRMVKSDVEVEMIRRTAQALDQRHGIGASRRAGKRRFCPATQGRERRTVPFHRPLP